MGQDSKIEWTHHTFNPWRGCTKVSQGCKHCYAETMSGRNPNTLGVWGPHGTRVIAAESYWRQPLKWNREAEAAGERRRVFCASLADVFEGPDTMPVEAWPAVEAARMRLWKIISDTPAINWLLLTKRPQNIRWEQGMGDKFWLGFPPNVWIGTSVEDQATADERIPHLLRVPAMVRFLSCEPLLGPVDLRGFITPPCSECIHSQQGRMPDGTCCIVSNTPPWGNRCHRDGVNWVIVGGESGPDARPMHPDWARSLRDQCVEAGVAFHYKQHGEFVSEADCPPNARVRPSLWGASVGASTVTLYRPGKHAAGRLLDGREWNEFPA